ncbi:MAG: hypothetical protein JRN33_03845 [Nitrososphaerota archaeon]|nr:hypothetical protein [Nitrososphaerota archaeon]MDG6955417.1 hypothetical protein [Nitrososphaerota archaeon]
MNGRKVGFSTLGIMVVLIGAVFSLQGEGYIPGSYMTGDPTYIYVGAVVAVVGLLIILGGNWPRAGRQVSTPAPPR